MLSVDTNVFVRLIVEDDARQVAVARSLLASGPIWVSRTVLLETDWVLRRTYELPANEIHDAFVALLSFPNVHSEDKASVMAALALTLYGIEFSDALHLESRPKGTEFVTFDRKFARRATRAGVAGITELELAR